MAESVKTEGASGAWFTQVRVVLPLVVAFVVLTGAFVSINR